MKLQVISDLHTEWHRDHGASFCKTLPVLAPTLVVAGDLGTLSTLTEVFSILCARWTRVVYTLGNHEFYGTTKEGVEKILASAARQHPNLHILQDRVVELEGVRILGNTLWFSEDPKALPYRSSLADFSHIYGFTDWVFAENARSIRFFQQNLRAGDVVVTHHLPTYVSVSKEFRGSPLNAFFVTDLTGLILQRKPKLWIHGHSHASCDHTLGETRVLNNPFGYLGQELNPGFSEELVVDV